MPQAKTKTCENPRTPEQWVQAVDAAEFYLLLHSAICYGLVNGAPKIDVGRCEWLLAEGRSRGIKPKSPETLCRMYLSRGWPRDCLTTA